MNVLIVGGSNMPTDIPTARNDLASVERTHQLAKTKGVEASFHPHPVFDGTLWNIAKINAAGGVVGSPNPLSWAPPRPFAP